MRKKKKLVFKLKEVSFTIIGENPEGHTVSRTVTQQRKDLFGQGDTLSYAHKITFKDDGL